MHINRSSFKLALSIVLLTFIAVLISSYVLYYHSIDSVKGDVEEYLGGIAIAVSKQIDGDIHTQFTSRDQETTPLYIKQITKLNNVKEIFRNIKFVYTAILKDGEVSYLDPTEPGIFENGVETKSHIMDKYDEAQNTPALLEAFNKRMKHL